MSVGNGRATSRDDTPEGGVSMMPLIRDAVEDGNLAQAILICANVTERCVTHSHLAAHNAELAIYETRQTRAAVETIQAHIASLRADTQAELDAISGRIIVAFGAQAVAIASLKEALGEAPRTIDPRESRAGEHSPEELARMESGTGLAGIVGRMRAEQSRAARKQALSVGAAAAFAPVAVELIKAFF